MKQTGRLFKNTGAGITMVLLLVLIGLGSCSLKRVFHTLLADPALSQQAPAPGKGAAASVCTGTESILSQDRSLPQPAFAFVPPLLPADFLSSFQDFGFSPRAGKQQAFSSRSRLLLHLNTVPLYLRNNSLLI